MTRCLAGLMFLALLGPAAFGAEATASKDDGALVRIAVEGTADPGRDEAPRIRRIEGRLVRETTATLTLALPGRSGTLDYPRSSIREIEMGVRRPRAAGALRAAAIGLAAGALAGATLGYASGDDTCDSQPDELFGCLFVFTRGEKAQIGAQLLGVLGTTIGAVVGGVSPGIRWRRATPVPRVTLAVQPVPSGLSVRTTIGF